MAGQRIVHRVEYGDSSHAFLREDYLNQVQRVSLTRACFATQDPEPKNFKALL
jgi:hypothetical protein